MKDLDGKVAFITGAAHGIGLGIARALGRARMKLVMTDIDEQALLAAAKSVTELGCEVEAIVLDTTDRARYATVADAAEARFGSIDVLCNNAGVGGGGAIDKLTFHDWDWTLGVNLGGVINGMTIIVPRMVKRGGGGHIVNTASIHALVTGGRSARYAAAKAAVVALSESARVDLAPHRIGVSALCPGLVNTRIYDSERNRPSHLAQTGSERTEEARQAGRRIFAQGLDPDRVGEMVLAGIVADKPYIFTHTSGKASISARFGRVLDAFDGSEAP